VCVLTRDTAIEVLSAVVCAPITRTIRGIASEVEVGAVEGLPSESAIPLAQVDPTPVGRLGPDRRIELDQAIRYALDIRF
jgi:mRNA interferase MazF